MPRQRRRQTTRARALAASPNQPTRCAGPIGLGRARRHRRRRLWLAYYYEVEKTRRQEQAAKKQTTYGKPASRAMDAGRRKNK